jgi:hypothetical protein
MGIRTNANTKDHLRQDGQTPVLSLVESAAPQPPIEDPLRFYTSHQTKACAVDLIVFKEGQQTRPNRGGIWAGPFAGRPELIAQLAPAIRDQLSPLAEKSVGLYLVSLRAWWRLFDAVEASAAGAMRSLTSVAQLSDVHRQFALDQGMRRTEFGLFLLLANTTRTALGLKPLYWQAPEDKAANRHLPPQWQTDAVRRELKHRWFSVIDRWSLADELRRGRVPLVDRDTAPEVYAEQERLLRNYERFDAVVAATSNLRPQLDSLTDGGTYQSFYKQGFNIGDMLRGSYPDGDDVRAAFHLCLATTGWNPAVLLSLDVTQVFIEQHPKDPGRYILRGVKARAGSTEQLNEGLFKSQGSAGVVIQTLMARTTVLRDSLRADLQLHKTELMQMTSSAAHSLADIEALRSRITALEQGLRSPWLFLSSGKAGTQWLTDNNFAKGSERGGGGYSTYLGDLVTAVNVRQPPERQLARLKPSDLRDAYAAYVYHASGGSVLSVMKALGHREVRSTQGYLHNTLLKEEHRKLFGIFSDALWTEMETHGRVDPTILAMRSRSGDVSSEQRERLHSYRTLMLSRLGVGCIDPKNPPRHIDPNFKADGKAMCHVQRCTLCLENAVLLPESLPGLCRRLAELRFLRSQMSVAAFQESSFLEELDNTELALLAFDAEESRGLVEQWEGRIASGAHRVIEFDGLAREVAR